MFRKLIRITGILILIVFIIVTLAFTTKESKNIICRDIEISFNRHDKKDVLRLVNAADKKIKGKSLEQINTEKIEKEVEKLQAIQEAQVYKTIVKDTSSYKGILVIKVKHRTPFVRIMSESGDYFLDEKGNKIPSSSEYTADVPVVTGFLSEKFATEKLLPFIKYLENDDFWKAQIEQIQVEKDGDILLIPLVGNHIIELGSFENYVGKLRNMRAFYNQVLMKNNWNKYKTISLKYSNQVIAKRN